MRSEHKAAARPRAGASRLAQPLLTVLGAATLLAASSFVVLAVASTGSLRPADWRHADLAAAVGRYRVCGQHGLAAVGCLLDAGVRPAAATTAAAGAARPLLSVATVQDPAPARSRSSAPGPAPASPLRDEPAAGTHGILSVPADASAGEALSLCRAAMRTALAQGAAAQDQVGQACQAALTSRCPAAATVQPAAGPALLMELEAACGTPASPRPGGDD